MNLNLDYTSTLAERIGSTYGITRDDLSSISEVFNKALVNISNQRKSGELPFWDLPFDEKMITEIECFADEIKGRFDDFVHLGIGGSALGPIALHKALNHPQHNLLQTEQRNGCRFFCPDNVDPDLICSVLDVTEPTRTLFHVVTKSGSTSETVSQFMLVLDLLKHRFGNKWKNHIVITTDPERGFMRSFVNKHKLNSFSIEPEIGGRFTVLTPVGLFPAAMTGINIRDICSGARTVSSSCFNKKLEENPAAMLTALLYLADTRKGLPIHVLFAYSNRLYPIADWFRQLWAESLGKRMNLDGKPVHAGPTPIKAIGATDQHSQVQLYVEGPRNKVLLFLGTKRFGRNLLIPDIGSDVDEIKYLSGVDFGNLLNTERQATAYALSKAGRMNMTLELDEIDAQHIGALLYLFETAVMYAGAFYNVNPLDQPGVEAGKRATYALMGRKGYEKEKEEIEHFTNKDRNIISLPI